MTITVRQDPDGSLLISREHCGSWSIEEHPLWGIKIIGLGSSKVPLCRDILDRPDLLIRQRAELGIEEPEPKPLPPIPMILYCPMCKARHIDEGDFATKPHYTHACQSCGFVWRPAIVNTVGVAFLPGFKNGVPA